jgi:hypothetical protein
MNSLTLLHLLLLLFHCVGGVLDCLDLDFRLSAEIRIWMKTQERKKEKNFSFEKSSK